MLQKINNYSAYNARFYNTKCTGSGLFDADVHRDEQFIFKRSYSDGSNNCGRPGKPVKIRRFQLIGEKKIIMITTIITIITRRELDGNHDRMLTRAIVVHNSIILAVLDGSTISADVSFIPMIQFSAIFIFYFFISFFGRIKCCSVSSSNYNTLTIMRNNRTK